MNWKFWGGKRRREAKREAARKQRKLEAWQKGRLRHIAASYDAAQTTDGNTRHWSATDTLSANAANSSSVRQTLRSRARYETANNGYADGIARTLANDVVGTGPTLQLLTESEKTNREIEREFALWCREVKLAQKLRTMRRAKYVDGEAFALLITNPRLKGPVKLDLRLIEAEQVHDPVAVWDEANTADGIWVDDACNPIKYRVLRQHPGDTGIVYTEEYDDWKPEQVVHWFDADRPGQCRGLPDCMPSLPLYALFRRWTLATIAAAETIAEMGALTIQARSPAVDDDDSGVEAMDTVELERNMATVLPFGYELGQAEPKQPTTTYREFKREMVTEIARPCNMPYNVAACDSSGYNYASGRLDHQTYDRSIGVERDDIDRDILDGRIFPAWLREYLAVKWAVRPSYVNLEGDKYPHVWMWRDREHVDPEKEAAAQEIRLRNHTTTLPDEWAKRGFDWETKVRQAARAYALLKELGLPLSDTQQASTSPDDGDEDNEEQDEQKKQKGRAGSKA